MHPYKKKKYIIFQKQLLWEVWRGETKPINVMIHDIKDYFSKCIVNVAKIRRRKKEHMEAYVSEST